MRAADRVDQNFRDGSRHGHRAGHHAGLQSFAGVGDRFVTIGAMEAERFENRHDHDRGGGCLRVEHTSGEQGGKQGFHGRDAASLGK